MNDQQNTNAGSNSATGNDDASHEGANMDTGLGNQSNDAESTEVLGTQDSKSTSEKGGENMSAKKRQPYDGSTAHGVTADVEHVQTITAYDNAVKRLEKRRSFLIGEYEDIRSSYNATDDVSERATLLKNKAAKEAQIFRVNKTQKNLIGLKSDIEAKELEVQATIEFIDFDVA